MGLLTEGSPLSWEETNALAEHVRVHGINQFLNMYNREKNRPGDILKWGDEIEYIIVKFDDKNRVARVALIAEELLEKLNRKENETPNEVDALWRPEYGAYMIEGTPGKPFQYSISDFNQLETNMNIRRQEVAAFLKKDECLMSLTNFPRLGTPNFTHPFYSPRPYDQFSASRSLYFPDEAIFGGHPRFKTVTHNVRLRRGSKVAAKLKVFKDKNTKLPIDGAPDGEPDVVLLDATGFGSGCSCLQMTFQAYDVNEARLLYDQLAPLCPILLAMTAASPIYRGYLTESDCRWSVISAAVDCRTEEERDLKPLKNNKFRINKSRYDSISMYLSEQAEKYNDIQIAYDETLYKDLRSRGLDHLMAQHVAHLFIRDTLALFSEKVDQNDEEDIDHFENIQTTNWQSMRFKPPPPNSSIGWRVEFRTCEVQITDFENAAFVCFIILLTRAILSFDLNFLIPISKVDENMKTAQKRDACRKEKFWFRNNLKTSVKHNLGSNGFKKCSKLNDEWDLMTIDEIFNGKANSFPGLIPIIRYYLQSMDVDVNTHITINKYLNFLGKRAAGKLTTTATWMRKEVLNHPEYRRDSMVSERINYDLLRKIQKIQQEQIYNPLINGEDQVKAEKATKKELRKNLSMNG